jgi:OOP family OmpA-OmpF porin
MDADGDGVFDGLDQCPDTPAGARVDASGCPIDSDNDGVFDGLDECADTPVNAIIDLRGCPIDSDGDGVYDGLDQCPTTPSHLFVDDHGCPIEVSETFEQLLDTGMIRTSDVRFRSGSSDLNTNDTDKLDEIGRTLSHWPELNIEVSGHTDSQGSEAGNNKLSTARAQAVTDYLVTKFPKIQSQQFIVLGHGESNPIADNSTFEGRATNRRVEFKVLNTDVIKRVHERRKMMER